MQCGVFCYVDGVVILSYCDLYDSFFLVLTWGVIVGVRFGCGGVDVNLLIVLVGAQLR